jgi:hypothetical protein
VLLACCCFSSLPIYPSSATVQWAVHSLNLHSYIQATWLEISDFFRRKINWAILLFLATVLEEIPKAPKKVMLRLGRGCQAAAGCFIQATTPGWSKPKLGRVHVELNSSRDHPCCEPLDRRIETIDPRGRVDLHCCSRIHHIELSIYPKY